MGHVLIQIPRMVKIQICAGLFVESQFPDQGSNPGSEQGKPSLNPRFSREFSNLCCVNHHSHGTLPFGSRCDPTTCSLYCWAPGNLAGEPEGATLMKGEAPVRARPPPCKQKGGPEVCSRKGEATSVTPSQSRPPSRCWRQGGHGKSRPSRSFLRLVEFWRTEAVRGCPESQGGHLKAPSGGRQRVQSGQSPHTAAGRAKPG